MKNISLLIISIILTGQLFAQDFSEWRGPGRTGVYDETGLLTEWPADGPEMIWSIEDLAAGYSSVSIANNMIYATGLRDTVDVLFALDMEGKLLWETVYGRAWTKSFSDSRATPTVEKDRVYVSSGFGDIACINANNGDIIWRVNASEKFGTSYGRWGISESLLLNNDKVYFTPGGEKTTMIALNKMTGKLIWKSESINDRPSYVSPLLISRNNKNVIIQVTNDYIIGVDPENGSIYWKFKFADYKSPDARNNQTNTPLYHEGKLYTSSGYNHYGVMLNLSEDAMSVEVAWVDSTLDVHHGGYVKVRDYIYGANWHNNRMGFWCCIDWESGKTMYETEWINKGSIIAAEGMLYCYEEKTGNIALVKATPEKFDLISSFKVPLGEGPIWSHPVIHKGILYVRHGGALMAYDIKQK